LIRAAGDLVIYGRGTMCRAPRSEEIVHKPSLTLAGRYQATRVLGEGGMGRVWAAQDLLLGREVAIKAMHPPPGLTSIERDRLRERALREGRAIARIDHPNVVRIIDVLLEQDEPWIVMELVPSRSLADVVRQDGPMAPERAAKVGLGLVAALRAAHESGLLHRDVKPANVLLGLEGRVVLTDFGLALVSEDSSITTTGMVVGSPAYLAPECVRDLPVGPAADLWSLGATLYFAVEGRPPYPKSSAVATLAAVAGDEAPRPPVRAGSLRPVLEALLEKDPALRADAGTADRMLRDVAAGGAAAVSRPPIPAAPPHHRRRRLITGAAAAAVAVLVAGAVAFVFLNGQPVLPAQSAAPLPPIEASGLGAGEPPPSPTSRPGDRAPALSSPPSAQGRRASRAPRLPSGAGTIDPGTWFRLVNRNSSKCVDVRGGVSAEGTPVQQFSCNSTLSQDFLLIPVDRVYLKIASRLDSVQSLDVVNQAPNDKATIQLWPFNGRQQWQAVPERDGYFHFVNRFSAKCLDVPDASIDDSAQLDQFSCNGTGAQSFRLEEV
jgi:hypothetical protein